MSKTALLAGFITYGLTFYIAIKMLTSSDPNILAVMAVHTLGVIVTLKVVFAVDGATSRKAGAKRNVTPQAGAYRRTRRIIKALSFLLAIVAVSLLALIAMRAYPYAIGALFWSGIILIAVISKLRRNAAAKSQPAPRPGPARDSAGGDGSYYGWPDYGQQEEQQRLLMEQTQRGIQQAERDMQHADYISRQQTEHHMQQTEYASQQFMQEQQEQAYGQTSVYDAGHYEDYTDWGGGF